MKKDPEKPPASTSLTLKGPKDVPFDPTTLKDELAAYETINATLDNLVIEVIVPMLGLAQRVGYGSIWQELRLRKSQCIRDSVRLTAYLNDNLDSSISSQRSYEPRYMTELIRARAYINNDRKHLVRIFAAMQSKR